MSDLRAVIKEYTDSHLLQQYTAHRDDYTAATIELMRLEIEERGLNEDHFKNNPDESSALQASTVTMNSEDFVQFDHSFSRVDLLLASTILHDNNIPFFPDNPTSNDAIPLEAEADRRFTIRIHRDFLEKSHTLLDEHFIKSDNKYILKYTTPRERLKAFNFHDIHLSEKEGSEEVTVELSDAEKKTIIALGRRLLNEAEAIESSQDRILFYFDAILPLIEQLENAEETTFSKNDLLAIIEILQVYCDDPDFPVSIEEAAGSLLKFFLGE